MKLFRHLDLAGKSSVGLGCILAAVSVNAAAPAAKPNMIWIMADDLGYGDLGCYGARDLRTPHIDSLARDGVKCERFYAAAPVCSPSRATTLTGRYPEALGIRGALMGEGGLPGDSVTIAKVLRQSGYTTGLVGKWHLGYEGKALPNSQGFDLFYGFRGGKIDYFGHTDTAQKVKGQEQGKHDFYENGKEIFPKGYSTDLFTRRAVQFVEDNKDRPFFLLLSYNAPHYARPGILQAPEEYIRRFAGEGKPTLRQLYAAMTSCMDDGVGKVLECLERNGLQENTLVMFVSDNGADPGNGGSNTPFANGKWKYTEGGVRVPMIAKWPGKLPAGAVIRDPLHMIDLFPTALAAAGVPKPEGLTLDGLDVLDVLAGKAKLPERPLFFGKDAICRGKWKLIKGKLHDLETDPGEREDLAGAHPEIIGSLDRLLRSARP